MVKLRKSNILAPKHGGDGVILASLVWLTCAVHIIQVSAESTEPESDEEIQRILDERHSKNTTKATKNALKTFSETVGDVQSLTSMQF